MKTVFKRAFTDEAGGLSDFINGRDQIYDLDRNNLAPRIGFAYSPDNLTVIRGGYGIYYDQILGAVVSQSRNVFPTFTTMNFGGTPNGAISTFSYSILHIIQPVVEYRLIEPGTLNTLNRRLNPTATFRLYRDYQHFRHHTEQQFPKEI